MHPKAAQARILLRFLLNRGHRLEVDRAEPWFRPGTLVLEPQPALFDPAAQGRVYGLAAGGQVGRDALGIPAFCMQRDDRVARRGWVGHLLVWWEAASRPSSWWSFRQHSLDGVRAGATAA